MAAFPKGKFPTLRDVSLTSEPEACALYTILELRAKDNVNVIPVSLWGVMRCGVNLTI